ncbi:NYN domain-containing protein [Metaplanococcus flavidus]|uniref:NYN domain-containing protein n=1 Tax=Metaplanococcus flavidus TaxID=569883 RepID=A0ABW3L7I4_9BACL
MNKSDITKIKDSFNAKVYVDYDNLSMRLASYGETIESLDFFRKISNKFTENGLYISEIVSFGNFETDNPMIHYTQSYLNTQGISSRHCSNATKNAGDLEMTVEGVKDLYTNKTIDVFVIISNDRDFIPLIKSIKSQNKVAIVICTKRGINKMLAEYANLVYYIEDLFTLEEKPLLVTKHDKRSFDILELSKTISLETITEAETYMAKNFADYLQVSPLTERYLNSNRSVDAVSAIGFLNIFIKNKDFDRKEAERIMAIAHKLEFIKIYFEEEIEKFCIK